MGHKITIHRQSQGQDTMYYLVTLPDEYQVVTTPEKSTSDPKFTLTPIELATRCDNGTIDLSKSSGNVHHFGGHVTRRSDGRFDVAVYLD